MSVEPRAALARRLRALREEWWPDAGITQSQLARAFGGRKPLSVSLISSWENAGKPVTPPIRRLEAYATFFATRRSIEVEPARLLPLEQLTEAELDQRERLLAELTGFRAGKTHATTEAPVMNIWRFPAGEKITIICAKLPADLLQHPYADPESPDFMSLYTYADPDALIDIYGYIRALNPGSDVTYRATDEALMDDYTTNLVLLGGVDWNVYTRNLFKEAKLPVSQVARVDDTEPGGFTVERNGVSELFAPRFDEDGRLVEDVAHFYRSVSPFNRQRTVTVCNGVYGRGTLAAVRALTDVRFRDRNQSHLDDRFGGAEAFSILMRVAIVNGQALTPDWTLPESLLHEWPENPG